MFERQCELAALFLFGQNRDYLDFGRALCYPNIVKNI